MSSHSEEPRDKKRYGYCIGDRFFMESDAEVKRMHYHYLTLIRNKEAAVDKRKQLQKQP
jgi:hypothetical protein